MEEFECCTTTAVREELTIGARKYPELAEVAEIDWLATVDLDQSLDDLYTFSEYMRMLGKDRRDAGEATVLAWAERNQAIALVDDQVACNIGRQRGVDVRRSLALIIHATKMGTLPETDAQAVVRRLTRTGARLPQEAEEDLFGWARHRGLL